MTLFGNMTASYQFSHVEGLMIYNLDTRSCYCLNEICYIADLFNVRYLIAELILDSDSMFMTFS